MQKVTIYTDGACSGNPGPGGWAAVLIHGEHKKEISGGSKETTNNIMELTAILEALKALKTECEVELYSDSAYSVNAFNQGWIYNWIKKGWKGANKQPVKNQDLWKRLLKAKEPHNVTFIWVKGHAGHEFNERCDQMAVKSANSDNLLEDNPQ